MDELNLDKLLTETVEQGEVPIESLSIEQLLHKMNEEDKKVPYAVEKAIPQIRLAVEAAVKSIKNGGRLLYIGAGTSGRLGVIDAAECPPTFGTSYEVQAIIAGGKDAFITAREGAEDSQELGKEDLKENKITDRDIIVGISASGRTPYVVGALRYARGIGATTVSIACNKDANISKEAEISIEVEVGPEVLAGSTRLKSGTAQKMILNMISTSTMVKCGKVFKSLMVDMKATNEKLKARSKRIVMLATGCTRDVSDEILSKTDYNIKLAIVMILTRLERTQAEKLLLNACGNVADAISKYL